MWYHRVKTPTGSLQLPGQWLTKWWRSKLENQTLVKLFRPFKGDNQFMHFTHQRLSYWHDKSQKDKIVWSEETLLDVKNGFLPGGDQTHFNIFVSFLYTTCREITNTKNSTTTLICFWDQSLLGFNQCIFCSSWPFFNLGYHDWDHYHKSTDIWDLSCSQGSQGLHLGLLPVQRIFCAEIPSRDEVVTPMLNLTWKKGPRWRHIHPYQCLFPPCPHNFWGQCCYDTHCQLWPDTGYIYCWCFRNICPQRIKAGWSCWEGWEVGIYSCCWNFNEWTYLAIPGYLCWVYSLFITNTRCSWLS